MNFLWYLILGLVVCSSCSIKMVDPGLTKYTFSDFGRRNLTFELINDSIIQISNKDKCRIHDHNLVNFETKYIFESNEVSSLVVKKVYKDSRNNYDNNIRYLKPFEYTHFKLSNNLQNYIFPSIVGDTLRFSADFRKLQVREFCFEAENPKNISSKANNRSFWWDG